MGFYVHRFPYLDLIIPNWHLPSILFICTWALHGSRGHQSGGPKTHQPSCRFFGATLTQHTPQVSSAAEESQLILVWGFSFLLLVVTFSSDHPFGLSWERKKQKKQASRSTLTHSTTISLTLLTLTTTLSHLTVLPLPFTAAHHVQLHCYSTVHATSQLSRSVVIVPFLSILPSALSSSATPTAVWIVNVTWQSAELFAGRGRTR